MTEDTFPEVARMLERFRRDGDGPIGPETDLRLDLELDSLAVMDLLMDVEDRFDVSIPLNALPELRTAGDLAGTIGALRGRG